MTAMCFWAGVIGMFILRYKISFFGMSVYGFGGSYKARCEAC